MLNYDRITYCRKMKRNWTGFIILPIAKARCHNNDKAERDPFGFSNA